MNNTFYSRNLIFLLFWSISIVGYCQNSYDIPEPNQMPVVKLDLDTGVLSSSFPFDKFFRLEISTKKYKIADDVSIFKVHYEKVEYLKYTRAKNGDSTFVIRDEIIRQLHPNKRAKDWKSASIYLLNLCEQKDFNDLIKRKIDSIVIDKYSKDPKPTVLNESEVKIDFKTRRRTANSIKALATLVDKDKYQIIIEPLDPGQLYEVVLKKVPSDKELINLLRITDLISSGKTCEAQREYNKKIMSLENSANRLSVPSFLNNYYIFQEEHKPKLSEIIQNHESQFKTSLESPLDSLLRRYVQIIGKKLLESELSIDAFSSIYNEFLRLDPVKLEELYLGRRKFANDTVIEEIELTKRIKILKHNRALIELANRELQKLSVTDSMRIVREFVENDFAVRNSLFKHNDSVLNKLNKKLIEYIKSNFQYSSLVSASTIDADIKTRNARVLVPDFGIMGSFAYDNDKKVKFIPRPFAGINIHFGGGIDKDQKLNQIVEKRVRHRHSLALGVTIGKINEFGFSDFFNGLSPMIGINRRIHEQIRIGAGVLWLREENPNPLIDKKPIEPAAYFSVSFDFNLFEQIGTLGKKVIN